jgi:transcriptional regulator with XRE-family HTH domain
MYGRVARKLGVDPSYVSRVARGERQSKLVDTALRRALSKIVLQANKQREGTGRTATRKTGRKG